MSGSMFHGALCSRLQSLMGSFFSTKVLVSLPTVIRRLLLIGIDALLLPLAVWLSFWLRLAHPFHPSFIAAGNWLLFVVLPVGLSLYIFTGQYKGLTRYVGSAALYRLAGRNGLLVLLLAALGVMLRLPMPPRSSWILLWLLLTGFTGAVRFALRDVLLNLRSIHQKHSFELLFTALVCSVGRGFAACRQSQDCHLSRRQSVLLESIYKRCWDPIAPGVEESGGLR